MKAGPAGKREADTLSLHLEALLTGALAILLGAIAPGDSYGAAGLCGRPCSEATAARENALENLSSQQCECRRKDDREGPGYSVLMLANPGAQARYFVDGRTYAGWLTYHTFCYICHDDQAQGGAVDETCRGSANLLETVRRMNVERFRSVVIDGASAKCGMPPWNDNPIVRARYAHIYSYLRARAYGDLPPFENGIPPRILPLRPAPEPAARDPRAGKGR